MKKNGLKIFGGLLALLILAFIALTLTIDGIVKSGIEKHGSQLMGRGVQVESVSISLFSGSGSVSGFSVQNPEGFSDEAAMEIGEMSMQIDVWSLFSDEILVEEITIKSPDLFFEQKGVSANLKVLNDNMMNYSESSSEKTMIIEYLLIEDGNIKVSTSIDREHNAEVSFSSIELEGIGRDGNNTISDVIRQVLAPILQRAMEEAIKDGVIDQIENSVRDLFDQ
ncbi:hypothetical protein [Gracilimonas sp.]|uniref:DUF748 domain-containing protein n=1 Tax=Gracilimonas sp. TaxID=1974203 RepID=UPI0028719C85|nr:hypothetical protein [Gracilimonas sp.]